MSVTTRPDNIINHPAQTGRIPEKSGNSPGFKWTPVKEKAAVLLAQADKSQELIAIEVGVTDRSLRNWLAEAAFQAHVALIIEEIRKAIRSHGIAVMENRVAALQRLWEKLNQVIDERAADPRMKKVPGGKTGLLVMKLKSIGSGKYAELIPEFEVDTGTIAEIRAVMKQAAQELGQWETKHDITTGGQPLYKVLKGVSLGEL